MNDLGKTFLPEKSAATRQTTALLRLAGEDASSFLQGQFSQETRSPLSQPTAYGLFLNHKGKVMGDAHLLKIRDAEWWLWSEATPAETLIQHLESFIIADDVTIENHSAGWTVTTLAGPSASEALLPLIGQPLPEEGAYVRVGEGFLLRGRRGLDAAWEWLAPAASLPPVNDWPGLDPLLMERARIEAGIPRVPVDIGPGDLPHEGGLDEAAISYSKGCYLGQEIMARLKSGRIRRRLSRVHGDGAIPGQLPATLYRDGRSAGELRTAVAAGDSQAGFIGLAMMSLNSIESGDNSRIEFFTTRDGSGPCIWMPNDPARETAVPAQ